MHISARVDYGIQAGLFLAQAQRENSEQDFCSAQQIARATGIPPKFLEGILADLRRSGLVLSHRGAHGGFSLARSAEKISLADIVRALDGPLAAVRGNAPESQSYSGSAQNLTEVWVALRSAMRDVLENCSLAQVESAQLPVEVQKLISREGAWQRR